MNIDESEQAQKTKCTNPATAASNMSPRTSLASSCALVDRASAAVRLAPAQNVATDVPTIHPDPVILPSNGLPLDSLITVSPSEIQSVTPVSTMMHPVVIIVRMSVFA